MTRFDHYYVSSNVAVLVDRGEMRLEFIFVEKLEIHLSLLISTLVAGLSTLMGEDRIRELQLLYAMCQRVHVIPQLKTALFEHVKVCCF